MSFYSELAADASELLQEFGRTLILRKPDTGRVYDDVAGEWSGGTPATDQEFWGVTLSPTEEYSNTVGTHNIQTRDMLVYAEATITPKLEDTVFFDGISWKVVNMEPVNPAGIPVLYVLQVRP